MKRIIITGCFLLMIIQPSFCQSPSSETEKRLGTEKRTGIIYNKIVLQKQNEQRIELYRMFSKYFIDSNIYPNADVIDLVDAYNKESNIEDIKSNKAKFNELKFPEISNELKVKTTTHRMSAVKPNNMLNISFKSSIETFTQKYQLVKTIENISAGFKDSLAMFGGDVLPAINNYSGKISATQMEFFNVSLQGINQLMGQFQTNNNVSLLLGLHEMMNDFFEFKANSIKGMKRQRANSTNPSGFYQAAYHPALADEAVKDEDETELANANVYVYTRGANGKWDQAPKPNSYNVYYGANGLKYSLAPGCDTLSFFRFHPSVPASTLPLVLAKGNYCFVFQDIVNGKLYLRPDINLRDNKVIDNTRLVKLCFKVEN